MASCQASREGVVLVRQAIARKGWKVGSASAPYSLRKGGGEKQKMRSYDAIPDSKPHL